MWPDAMVPVTLLMMDGLAGKLMIALMNREIVDSVWGRWRQEKGAYKRIWTDSELHSNLNRTLSFLGSSIQKASPATKRGLKVGGPGQGACNGECRVALAAEPQSVAMAISAACTLW